MPTESEIAARVHGIVAAHAPLAPPAGAALEAASLADLGFDSIRILDLLFACESAFGVTIAADVLEGGPLTVAALVAYILRVPAAREAAGRG